MECPVHGTEMYYAWRQDLYACQLRECEYGRGVRVEVLLSAIVPDRIPSTAKEGPHMTMREWAGRAVALTFRSHRPRFPMMLLLSEDTARKLAISLANLKQLHSMGLFPEVEEINLALNYVLVADPESVAAHRRMEASKGMEPSGGH
jgi:hypothetical protein